MKKTAYSLLILLTVIISACKSNNLTTNEKKYIASPEITSETTVHTSQIKKSKNKNEITLLFGGDIMAHNENYNISSYDKIWADVKDYISSADLAFANIESPVDTTKPVSSYPQFNMDIKYVEAAVDAGFNVFSLCNNHTNDKGLESIIETEKSLSSIAEKAKNEKHNIYFSGLRPNQEKGFSYNVINCKNWKIVFFPITEIINLSTYTSYLNYLKPTDENRQSLLNYITKIKKEENCDLFILSIHTNEPEYIRKTTEQQENYYMSLLDSGVDIIMANHPHIIKDRKVVVDTKTNSDKLIMYANGNIISGQRRNPDFFSNYPDFERDNTGDGLLFKVILSKDEKNNIDILKAETLFITTYINTAHEFIIKKMDDNFINYLYDVDRINWANYIKKRIRINKNETKDLIEWR